LREKSFLSKKPTLGGLKPHSRQCGYRSGKPLRTKIKDNADFSRKL
jgi:hypothetical protein